MNPALPGLEILDRMERAVEAVRNRLLRATGVLETATIPYAVIGGNAVAAWVAKVDEAAVRNTRDVNILLRRPDLPAAIDAMQAAGFVYRHSAGIDMFLDGPGAKARDAVHVIFAGEKVRQEDALPTPDVTDALNDPPFRYVSFSALLRMKLVSFRKKDQVHIEDFLTVGLVDQSWIGRVPPVLAPRLKQVIEEWVE